MKRRVLWLAAVALALGLSADVAGPRLRHWWRAPRPGYCPVCQRHEHRDSVVKFRAEGEGVIEACCLSCALNYGRQTSKAITILSVTDHNSGKPIDPDGATFVVGSEVSPCTHHAEQLRLEGEAVPVRWDRCLPSILAFSSAESAAAFRAQHGGELRRLQELRQQAAANESLH